MLTEDEVKERLDKYWTDIGLQTLFGTPEGIQSLKDKINELEIVLGFKVTVWED